MNARRPRSRPRAVARWSAALIALVALAIADVSACPICFRFEENRVTDGLRLGVLVLVGVTGVVLAGFGWFIAGFVRRSRRHP